MEDDLSWRLWRGVSIGALLGVLGSTGLYFTDPTTSVKVNRHAQALGIPLAGMSKDPSMCKYWRVLGKQFKQYNPNIYLKGLTKCDDLYFIADRSFGSEETIDQMSAQEMQQCQLNALECFGHMYGYISKLKTSVIEADKNNIALKDKLQRSYDANQTSYLLKKSAWEARKTTRRFECLKKGLVYDLERIQQDEALDPCPTPPIKSPLVDKETLLDKFNRTAQPIIEGSEVMYLKIRAIHTQRLPAKVAAAQEEQYKKETQRYQKFVEKHKRKED